MRGRSIRALRLDLGLEADRIKIITFLPFPSLLECERYCISPKPLPSADAALLNHSILLHERCATATHHLRAKKCACAAHPCSEAGPWPRGGQYQNHHFSPSPFILPPQV
ncbi:unnamed protein product [Prorocentrum cordatum]|uniref:Uncharacterized protein n=1 Tax=Prorocentrum cordatum TaxID=2364126 RepID=A0ABN9QPD3_9DINO|nr:unnamed protein product [Polarella glacialis]